VIVVIVGWVSGTTRGRLYIALAALAWSSAGVLQRQLTLDIPTQLAGRAFFSTLGLLAFVVVTERRRVVRAFTSMGRTGVGFALSMAGSSAAFIAALNHTTVANVLFMQAAAPFVAALLAWALLHEHVARRTWIAMALALAGVGVMAGGPDGSMLGLVFAFGMMLGFAVSLVLARRHPEVSMGPATCLAQFAILAAFAPFSHPATIDGAGTGWLAALGIGQIGLGLALLVLGARLITAAEIALISLLEVVLGPLWVWLADGERPSRQTLVGGGVVVAAVAIGSARRPRVAGWRFSNDVAATPAEET